MQLLWGRHGRWACDFAVRSVGHPGEPRFVDVVGAPPLHLQPAATRARRDDDPDVWSTR